MVSPFNDSAQATRDGMRRVISMGFNMQSCRSAWVCHIARASSDLPGGQFLK